MGETIQKNEITKELENAEVLPFGKKDFNAYNRLMANIEKGFTKASEAYVLIACNLWQINRSEYFRIDSYKTIADFALEKYDMKKSTVHNYIKVVEKFGEIVDGKAIGLKEQFKDFKCSQLVNMLTFTPEQIEQVDPSWSVRDIIAFGKAPLFLDTTDDEDEPTDTEGEASEFTEDSVDDFLNVPDIVSGRTCLLECYDFEDIIKNRDVLLNAFNDMKKDKNFKNKNVRLVVELAFD